MNCEPTNETGCGSGGKVTLTSQERNGEGYAISGNDSTKAGSRNAGAPESATYVGVLVLRRVAAREFLLAVGQRIWR